VIAGRVQHGQKLGRTLGFPTLNISMGSQTPVLHGIYTVTVHGLSPQPLPAVASLGTRPAVEANGRFKLEVYVLDWSGDAYGKRLQIEFHEWLRDEANYAGLEALKIQIAKDVINARQWFRDHPSSTAILQHSN
jgi:riboflavin kinase / FMN adenylyltransferase